MNIVDNIVNTYAWMKLTNVSMRYINSEKRNENMVVPPPTSMPPISLNMKMSDSSTSTII